MPEAEVIAYHGWGFNASCWRTWQKLWGDEVRWMNFDRGYFGARAQPHFKHNDHIKIIIAHSFGLHLCSDKLLKEADFVVIFAGFLAFHPQDASMRRRSERVVSAMIRQFKIAPEKVVQAFYGNVFYPEKHSKSISGEMNAALLLSDLKRLNSNKRSLPELKRSSKVCIFHGSKDAIVPGQKSRALKNYLGNRARYFEIQEAGHALPFTHARECGDILKSEMIS